MQPPVQNTTPATKPPGGFESNLPKPTAYPLPANPNPAPSPYAPKSTWGYMGDALKDWAGIATDAVYNPSNLGNSASNMGRQLWEGTKALASPLPHNYADDPTMPAPPDGIDRGTVQYFPIGYPNPQPGAPKFISYGNMAQAQGADQGIRELTKGVPYAGAVPAATDAYSDFSHGDLLGGLENTAYTALALTPLSGLLKGTKALSEAGAARNLARAGQLGVESGEAAAAASRAAQYSNIAKHTKGSAGVISSLLAGPSTPLGALSSGVGSIPVGVRSGASSLLSGLRGAAGNAAGSFADAGGLLWGNVAKGSNAFKGAVNALRGGELANAGGQLYQGAKQFGSLVPNTLASLEHVGGSIYGAGLESGVGLLPQAIRPATAKLLNNGWIGPMLPSAPNIAAATPNVYGVLQDKALKFFGVDHDPYVPTQSSWQDTLNSIGDYTNHFGTLVGPSAALNKSLGGLSGYLKSEFGYDKDYAQKLKEFNRNAAAPQADPVIGKGPDGTPLYQSQVSPGPMGPGLSVPLNSVVRDPRSNYLQHERVQQLVSQDLTQQGISYKNLTQEGKNNAYNQAVQILKDNPNVGTTVNMQIASMVEAALANGQIPNTPQAIENYKAKIVNYMLQN